MIESLALVRIRRDGDTQSRVALNQEKVAEYTEKMRTGTEFPPLVVFRDDKGNDWLADGFHRHEAAQEATKTHFDCDVREGTVDDARHYSYGANDEHGLPRSNADKRHVVTTALKHPDDSKLSDREIARLCKVSHNFVSVTRRELETSGVIGLQQERTGADGKTYTVPKERHWGFSNGMPFWSRVQSLGLDRDNVLERLQPGAETITQLDMDKATAWKKLDELAIVEVSKQFHVNAIVKHPTGRFGVVAKVNPTTIVVAEWNGDPMAEWMLSGVVTATQEEFTAYRAESERLRQIEHNLRTLDLPEAPTFALDDRVLVEGSDAVGVITDIGGVYRGHEGEVRVTRPNPNGGSNMTHWVSATKVKKVDAPEAAPTVAKNATTDFEVGDRVGFKLGNTEHTGVIVELDGQDVKVKDDGHETYIAHLYSSHIHLIEKAAGFTIGQEVDYHTWGMVNRVYGRIVIPAKVVKLADVRIKLEYFDPTQKKTVEAYVDRENVLPKGTVVEPPLKEGDTVKNTRNGQTGQIVGFQGDAAFVEGVNGKRLVGRDFLERVEQHVKDPVVDEWAGDSSIGSQPEDAPPKRKYLTWQSGGEWHVKLPMADRTCCGLEFIGEATSSVYPTCSECIAAYNATVDEAARLPDLNAKETPDSPRTLDEIAPRPWSVEERAVPWINDSNGKFVVNAPRNLADFIVAAVNDHRDYQNDYNQDILPDLQRLLDIRETKQGEIDDLLGAYERVNAWLSSTRMAILARKWDLEDAAKKQAAQPEVAAP